MPIFENLPVLPFLIKRAALGNLKANFHCAHLHSFIPLQKPPPLHSVFFNCLYAPSAPHLRNRNGTQTASLQGWRGIRDLHQIMRVWTTIGDTSPKLILHLKDIQRNVLVSIFRYPIFHTILLNLAHHKLDDYDGMIHTNLQIVRYRDLDITLVQN